ncbi:hypothetical protein E2C01_026537 [Portunus trituberculatus]|uniref:Uncharacterized protein n=1 Tax=Portunus trituberculatus TaxID=210409 RepID=A0A5B7EL83_PORTR|nr:hypothetical protein [Portunus trituberculatus]
MTTQPPTFLSALLSIPHTTDTIPAPSPAVHRHHTHSTGYRLRSQYLTATSVQYPPLSSLPHAVWRLSTVTPPVARCPPPLVTPDW